MKNSFRFVCLAAVLAAAILVALSGFAQEDIKKVDDAAFRRLTRAAVPFDHDEHNAKAGIEDCSVCHHLYKNGKKVAGSSEDTQCSECHLAKGKGSMDLIKAYHDLCKGCHMEKKTGPVTCAECHPNRM
jgi:hypothetical protein